MGLVVAACHVTQDDGGVVAGDDEIHMELVCEIGRGPGGPAFTQLVDGFLWDPYTIILADAQELVLWRIPLRGGEPQRMGRRGEGPGEFIRINAVGAAGDSAIWVTDWFSGRVTWLSADGSGPVTSRTIRDYWFEPPMAPVGPSGVLADGRFLVYPRMVERRPSGNPAIVPHPLIAVEREGPGEDTLVATVHAPPPGGVVVPLPDGGLAVLSHFMAEVPLVGLSPEGDVVGFLDRFGGTGSTTGGLLHILRLGGLGWQTEVVPIPVSSVRGTLQELEDRLERMGFTGERSGAPSRVVAAVREALMVPEWISPVVLYRVDRGGRHWVGLEPRFRGPRRWLRGEADGTKWLEVKFDHDVLWPVDASEELVVAVLTDSLDVQSVGVFRRPGGGDGSECVERPGP